MDEKTGKQKIRSNEWKELCLRTPIGHGRFTLFCLKRVLKRVEERKTKDQSEETLDKGDGDMDVRSRKRKTTRGLKRKPDTETRESDWER